MYSFSWQYKKEHTFFQKPTFLSGIKTFKKSSNCLGTGRLRKSPISSSHVGTDFPGKSLPGKGKLNLKTSQLYFQIQALYIPSLGQKKEWSKDPTWGTLKTFCEVKEVSRNRPHVVWFHDMKVQKQQIHRDRRKLAVARVWGRGEWGATANEFNSVSSRELKCSKII